MSHKYYGIFCFVVLTSLLGASVGHSSFLYQKKTTAPESSTYEIGAISFDRDLYVHTNDSFSNIRLFDEENKEIPYVIRLQKTNETITTTKKVPLTTIDLKELSENQIIIILENKADRAERDRQTPSHLEIKTPNKNFQKSVSIFGSNDKEQWTVLAEKTQIFDYSQYIDLRETSVSFERAPFVYYKVLITNVAEVLKSPLFEVIDKYVGDDLKEKYVRTLQYDSLLHIDGLVFTEKEDKLIYDKNKTQNYALQIVQADTDDVKKTTTLLLDSDRQPVSRMIFSVSSVNFKRTLFIEGTNTPESKTGWKRIASGNIFNIKAGSFQKENLEVNLSSVYRFQRYRIQINNDDNQPIDVVSAMGMGPMHEILFFHNNQKNVKVLYGGQDIQKPVYDVIGVLSEAPAIEGGRWSLSEQEDQKTNGLWRLPFKTKTLLIGALVLMVAVLLYVVIISVKKIDSPKET